MAEADVDTGKPGGDAAQVGLAEVVGNQDLRADGFGCTYSLVRKR